MTRQEIAVITYDFLKNLFPNKDFSVNKGYERKWDDYKLIGTKALVPLAFMNKNQLISEETKNKIAPTKNVTKEQAMDIVYKTAVWMGIL